MGTHMQAVPAARYIYDVCQKGAKAQREQPAVSVF